nr:PTS sugar transporter subunit IIA [Sinorhizobium fredii]
MEARKARIDRHWSWHRRPARVAALDLVACSLVYATSAPIDFKSPDLEPVDLVFTLLWPRSEVRTFLPALSQLFRFVRAPLIREGLRLARSPEEVMAILQSEAWSINEIQSRTSAAQQVAVR